MLGDLGNPDEDDDLDKHIVPNNRSVAALIDKVK
jgi:hypothetical protein